MRVRVKVLSGGKLPAYQSAGASGFDVHARTEGMLRPGSTALFPTGIELEIPIGFEAQVRPRSGLALKQCTAAILGTVDADYRGEVGVILHNYGTESLWINAGERIAQIVIAPVVQAELVQAEELSETVRGTGGFGSTGK